MRPHKRRRLWVHGTQSLRERSASTPQPVGNPDKSAGNSDDIRYLCSAAVWLSPGDFAAANVGPPDERPRTSLTSALPVATVAPIPSDFDAAAATEDLADVHPAGDRAHRIRSGDRRGSATIDFVHGPPPLRTLPMSSAETPADASTIDVANSHPMEMCTTRCCFMICSFTKSVSFNGTPSRVRRPLLHVAVFGLSNPETAGSGVSEGNSPRV